MFSDDVGRGIFIGMGSLALAALLVVMGVFIGVPMGRAQMEREAIMHQQGKYLQNMHGTPTFQWNGFEPQVKYEE